MIEAGLQLRDQLGSFSSRWRSIPWGVILSVLLICLGAPRSSGPHLYPAALIGIAPLLAIGWRELGWRELRVIAGVWIICCGLCLAPDFRSVGWLEPVEIGVGLVGYLLLPWILIGVSCFSLRLTQAFTDGIRPLAIAAVWVLWDGLWGTLRFPIPLHWGALVYDWIWGIQIADRVGIWGVTFYAILINATVALWIQPQIQPRQKRWGTWIAVVVSVLVLSYGGMRLAQVEQQMIRAESYRVAAIQPVAWLDRDRSWSYRLSQYQQLFRLSAAGVDQGAQLVIWPEGSLRAPLRDTALEPFLLGPMMDLLPDTGGLLLGTTEPVPRSEAIDLDQAPDPHRHYNAALLYNAHGDLIGRSGKRWIFPLFESRRHRPYGSTYRPILSPEFGSLGVMICLESVLPGPSRQLVQAGAESLIVLADDSSFGRSNWVALHGALSVFRAVENRRSLVFVNNTGQSLIVDPTGRIQSQGPLFEPAALGGQVIRLDHSSEHRALASGL